MTREEAEAYAKDMTYRDAVHNALQGKCIPYRKATLIKLNELLDKLEQEPCDVPDINDGNIYKCPCGYEWDKSKVVRHHFCPNCGRTVNSSYNSIKPELKSCEDAISRQDAIKKVSEILKGIFVEYEDIAQKAIGSLPYVTPQPQPKTGYWIFDEILDKHYYCSECKSMGVDYWDYCPYCGAKMVEPQESEDKG